MRALVGREVRPTGRIRARVAEVEPVARARLVRRPALPVVVLLVLRVVSIAHEGVLFAEGALSDRRRRRCRRRLHLDRRKGGGSSRVGVAEVDAPGSIPAVAARLVTPAA